MHRSAIPPLLLLVAVSLAACSSAPDDGDGPRAWRDLDLTVPDGWVVIVEREDLLQIANQDIRIEDLDDLPSLPDDPDTNDVVDVQFSADASVGPEAWRALVDQEGGQIEEDTRISVGGLPATSITYLWASNGVPAREQVVFVPSRQLYILLQPVPIQGQTNAAEVFLDHTDEFEEILTSIRFGRPFDDTDGG